MQKSEYVLPQKDFNRFLKELKKIIKKENEEFFLRTMTVYEKMRGLSVYSNRKKYNDLLLSVSSIDEEYDKLNNFLKKDDEGFLKKPLLKNIKEIIKKETALFDDDLIFFKKDNLFFTIFKEQKGISWEVVNYDKKDAYTSIEKWCVDFLKTVEWEKDTGGFTLTISEMSEIPEKHLVYNKNKIKNKL